MISRNSKVLVKLGKVLYTSTPDSIGIPCSAEELYSTPVDRAAVQPLFHTDSAGEHENMKRALFVDTKRRNATQHMAIATIPMMFVVFLIFSSVNLAIKPSDKSQQVQSSNEPSYLSIAYNWTKNKLTSDESKLARAKEIQIQVQAIRGMSKDREDYETQTAALQAEFHSLRGDARIGLEMVKTNAESIKDKLAKGEITQEQFENAKNEILARKQKYEAALK